MAQHSRWQKQTGQEGAWWSTADTITGCAGVHAFMIGKHLHGGYLPLQSLPWPCHQSCLTSAPLCSSCGHRASSAAAGNNHTASSGSIGAGHPCMPAGNVASATCAARRFLTSLGTYRAGLLRCWQLRKCMDGAAGEPTHLAPQSLSLLALRRNHT